MVENQKRSIKIVTIVGARPQFIKAAMVTHAIERCNKNAPSNAIRIFEVMVHTGQHFHRNMSDTFFDDFNLAKPKYNLGICNSRHGKMTGKMLEKIETVLYEEHPDLVLVYGDTNSTLAGALAASKLHIPIGHVEAGLHSFNRQMPEEINRVVADHLSTLLFCPTTRAVENLKAEGITRHVFDVGDVMYDAHLLYESSLTKQSGILQSLSLAPKRYLMATIHRAENTDNPDRLRSIFKGLITAADKMPVIIPLHPRTKKALEAEDLLEAISCRLLVIDPIGYVEMLSLEKNARLIATDSGGVQKEAFFCGVPCLIFRDETEWTELVDSGGSYLVGTDEDRIVTQIEKILEMPGPLPVAKHMYGEGQSADRIVEIIHDFISTNKGQKETIASAND